MNDIVKVDTYKMESLYQDKYGKTTDKELEEYEIKNIYALLKTFKENGLNIIFDFKPSSCAFCIFKNPEKEWMVLDSCESEEGYLYGMYHDSHEACLNLIKRDYEIRDKKEIAHAYINNLNQDINNETMNHFIEEHQIKFNSTSNIVYEK